VKNKIVCSFVIFGLLAATSAQAGSYKLAVKRYMKGHLETMSESLERLDNGEAVCGIGVQDAWNRTVVSISEAGTTNSLQPGDEIMSVNGEDTVDEPGSFQKLVRKFSSNDQLTLTVMRSGEAIDLKTTCIDGSQKFGLQAEMLRFAAKGKWKQCVATSENIDALDGRKSLFTATYRNTCIEANRCGWRCKNPTLVDAKSLYEVNVTELEAVTLANVKIGGVEASVQNGIKWLEEAGYADLATDLQSRFSAADASQSNPVIAISLSSIEALDIGR
jgi:hypothetical protein